MKTTQGAAPNPVKNATDVKCIFSISSYIILSVQYTTVSLYLKASITYLTKGRSNLSRESEDWFSAMKQYCNSQDF